MLTKNTLFKNTKVTKNKFRIWNIKQHILTAQLISYKRTITSTKLLQKKKKSKYQKSSKKPKHTFTPRIGTMDKKQ